jgi:hypothetical protein
MTLTNYICNYARGAREIISCETPLDIQIDIPKDIKKMVSDYPETSPLLDYYREAQEDENYFSREIDISMDLLTDETPLFIQWDKRWAFLKYGKEKMVATSGCGPTCLAMIAAHFTKNADYNPKYFADFSASNHYYIEDVGTKWELFSQGAKRFGLIVSNVAISKSAVYSALDEDKILAANVRAGHFTRRGHYIIIKGYDKNGAFFICDPNSVENSKRSWPPEIVIGESKKIWGFSR